MPRSDAGRMPGIELAAAPREPLLACGEGGELLDELLLRLRGEECDLIALRVGRDVAERVALHHGGELGVSAHDHVHVESEALPDQPFALGGQLRRCERAREDDVPALDVGAHVLEAGVLEVGSQLRHRDAVVRADVDAAEEDDVLSHHSSPAGGCTIQTFGST
jgi:hypothetical protein